jgi:hypothetical protein
VAKGKKQRFKKFKGNQRSTTDITTVNKKSKQNEKGDMYGVHSGEISRAVKPPRLDFEADMIA